MRLTILCCALLMFSLIQPHKVFADDEVGISEEQPKKVTAEPSSSVATSTDTVTTTQSTPEAATGSPVNDQVGTIVIETTPEGASIDINGTHLGDTPWKRSGFLPGFYRVTLQKEGFPRFQKTVEVLAGNTVSVAHNFEGTSAAAPVETPLTGDESPSETTGAIQQAKGSGTLTVTCNTDSANVVINKVKLGVTPFSRTGFLPGFYEVELKKSGYDPFRKMVKVANDSTTLVKAELDPYFGRLIINSTPEKAKVLINDMPSGTTPYDSTGIKPNLYTVRLELANHVPWTTRLTIERNKTDSLNVDLISFAVRDSLKKVHSRRFRIFRRIAFGTLTAGFAAAGTYYNSRADQQLAVEKDAWDAYMEPNRSTAEYDARYTRYKESTETTDLFLKRRNAMYILGGIFGIGLALSIPF
jgi:hypothetical protein